MVITINPWIYFVFTGLGLAYFALIFWVYADTLKDAILLTLQLVFIFICAYFASTVGNEKQGTQNTQDITEVVEQVENNSHSEYYAVGYKYMDFNDLGTNKMLFVTNHGNYEYVNTFNMKLEDYTDCCMLMNDNGTPDNYNDDVIEKLFVNYNKYAKG